MKLYSRTSVRFATLFGIAAAMSLGGFRLKADEHDKWTVLTINQPIQVTDTLLEPGKYVFKLGESSANRHIVQIFNGDATQLINTVLAIPNYRLTPTGKSRFIFWETPTENVQALRAWFYPGDSYGQEFPYPKQLALARVSQSTLILPPAAPPTVQTPPVTEPPPPEPPQVSLAVPPPPEQQTQVPPPAPAPEVQQTPSPQPETLPSTASVYPLAGIGGLFCLGLYGALRLKRAS